MSEPTTAQSIRLTDEQTLHAPMLMGQQHIPLRANGYSCQTADVWRIVLAAAARRTTIEAACAELERTPTPILCAAILPRTCLPVGFPIWSGNGMRCSVRSCRRGWRPVRTTLRSISMLNRTMVKITLTILISGSVAGKPVLAQPASTAVPLRISCNATCG